MAVKLLRVWVKRQLDLKFFEKILKFTYENLNGKLNFTHFLSDLPGPFLVYISLENNTTFLQQNFRFRGDLPPSPAGALALNDLEISLICEF